MRQDLVSILVLCPDSVMPANRPDTFEATGTTKANRQSPPGQEQRRIVFESVAFTAFRVRFTASRSHVCLRRDPDTEA